MTTKERQFIPMIYNYCDRWCERCPMTKKCENASLIGNSISSSDALEKMTQILEESLDWARAILEAKSLIKQSNRVKAVKLVVEQNVFEIEKVSKAYGLTIRDFLNVFEQHFFEKAAELDTCANVGLEEMAYNDFKAIKEARDTINWHAMLIHVKLVRAYRGMDVAMEYSELHHIQTDFNGSAKIAIVSIRSSIAAFETLMAYFPELEDNILTFLVLLQQIEKGVIRDFPNVLKFQRPGFDD